ncbi:MAG: hypothetical protein J6L76_08165 [Clostridia bacterium]|nr:hypothetical protein [Clostridia bacterium]
MKNNYPIRRLLAMFLLLAMVVSVSACGDNGAADSTEVPSAEASGDVTNPTAGSGTKPTAQATQKPSQGATSKPTQAATSKPTVAPTAAPATGNEKPDVSASLGNYKDVKIYDKFGTWPLKTGKEYYSSEVGTWFTIWWDDPRTATGQFHWYDECRLKPVDYGYYSGANQAYVTSVFARLKYIGIDFLLLDDTNGHWNDNGVIARNMVVCFKVAEKLKGFAPKIAIATGAPLRDGDTAQQQKEFDEYYKHYNKYKDYFYKYNGKPLLVNYIAGVANARYNDSRFTIRYGTGLISWQNKASDQSIFKTQGNWGWVFDTQNKGSEIMGVQPGYNKPGMESAVVKREGGKHYIEQWLAAIKANPKVIMIPSYNDHCEETGWEATVPVEKAGAGLDEVPAGEDPYLYEKITEAYLALRYGYIDGFFYKVEGTSQVYKYTGGALKKVDASAAGKNPVILLPKGYIEWEQSR